jgi:PhnB protein
MTTGSSRASDEAQIRGLINDWAESVRTKDVDGIMSHYAADIVTFDLAPPLQYAGADALRKSLEAWFPTFRGAVGYEIRELSITTGDEVAFCRSLNRISGTRTDGEETGVWVRATIGLRKIDGKWKVTHEHSSVPFYMDGSYRAAVDLEP